MVVADSTRLANSFSKLVMQTQPHLDTDSADDAQPVQIMHCQPAKYKPTHIHAQQWSIHTWYMLPLHIVLETQTSLRHL